MQSPVCSHLAHSKISAKKRAFGSPAPLFEKWEFEAGKDKDGPQFLKGQCGPFSWCPPPNSVTFSPSVSSLLNFVCHTCFKRQEKLHHCGQCKFARYCDRTCQKDAWVNHKKECLAIKRYGKVPNENIRSELGPVEMFGISGCQVRVVAVTAFPGPRKPGYVQSRIGPQETRYGHVYELPSGRGAHLRGRMG